ncbi:MotE family protein [Thermovibrio sp.]
MKGKFTALFTALIIAVVGNNSFSQELLTEKEVKTEIERLKELQKEVEKEIKSKEELLKKIEEEREKLKKEREELEKRVEEVKAERYKKLAQVFEKMDPELAGQKISALTDPKEAAYIIYNMKPRKAGEVMNYVNPQMVDKIVKILTQIKNPSCDGKPSPKS